MQLPFVPNRQYKVIKIHPVLYDELLKRTAISGNKSATKELQETLRKVFSGK